MSTSPMEAATAVGASASFNGTSKASSKEEEEERRLRERIQAKMQSRRSGGKQMSADGSNNSVTGGGGSRPGVIVDNGDRKERTNPMTTEHGGGAVAPLLGRKRGHSPSPVKDGKDRQDEKGRRRRRRRRRHGRSSSPARSHRGHIGIDQMNGRSNSDRRTRGQPSSSREVRGNHYSSRDRGPFPPHLHEYHRRHHRNGDGGGYDHGRYPQGPPLPPVDFRSGYPGPPSYYGPRGGSGPPPHIDHATRGSPRMYPTGGGDFPGAHLQHMDGNGGEVVDDFGRVRMVRSYRRPPRHHSARQSRSRSRSRSASHSTRSRSGSRYSDRNDDYSRSDDDDSRGSRSSSSSRSDSRSYSRSRSQSTASASPAKGGERFGRRNGGGRRGRSRSRSESSRSRSNSHTSSSDSRSNHDDESSISTDDGHDEEKQNRVGVERKENADADDKIGEHVMTGDGNPPEQQEASTQVEEVEDAANTKDQRTVFVSQLVMRTSEKDLQRFFRRHGCPVNEVSWLRDKRTGRHKGSAYVELKRKKDVATAVKLSGQAPDFQRFPILIKACEASDQNYLLTGMAATNAAALGVAGHSGGMLVGGQVQQLLTTLTPTAVSRVLGPNGKYLEAQKVYVGSLDPAVTQEHLIVLFRPLGQLLKVSLQMDTTTGISKGFAFLTYADAAEANLAIQTMAGQVLAGRPIKTGWAANQVSSSPNTELVTSDQFPPDASIRAQRAYQVLAQLALGLSPAAIAAASASGAATSTATAVTQQPQQQQRPGGLAFAVPNSSISDSPTPATFLTGSSLQTSITSSTATSRVPTVAEARASLAAAAAASVNVVVPSLFQHGTAMTAIPLGVTTTMSATLDATADPFKIGNANNPTTHILVHNMFNKDEETEEGWAEEIRQEFEEECSKFGSITNVSVQSEEPGGKIYASFDSIQAAQNCASSLAGRWFDKRQLRVEFVEERSLPLSTK